MYIKVLALLFLLPLMAAAGSLIKDDNSYAKEPPVSRVCPINSADPKKNLCVCGATAQGIYVTCNHVTNRTALASSLKNLYDGYRLEKLGMVQANLTFEPQDFQSVKFAKMEVESSVLRVDGHHDSFDFNGNGKENNLRVVQFRKSKIDLGDTTLFDTGVLESLEFDNCSFGVYPDFWFKRVKARKLRIVRSPEMTQRIAKDIAGLQEYRYTKSKLLKLNETLLPDDKESLTTLDFSENAINEISKDFLKDIPNLNKIDLSGNKLERLSGRTFRNFKGEISASGNALKCDSRLYWLKERYDNRTLQYGDLITCCYQNPDGSRTMIAVKDMLI